MAAMIVSAIVIVGYTAAGGFLAASTTDFIQSIVMTIAIVFVLGFSTFTAGGIDAVIENARTLPGYLSFTNTINRRERRQRALYFPSNYHYGVLGAWIFRNAAYIA